MAKQDYIDVIAYCDQLKVLPETARGNLILFLIYWIKAGCRPIDVNQIQLLIGMRNNVWIRYKDAVKIATEALMPELIRVHQRKEKERVYFNNYHREQKEIKLKQSTLSDNDILQEQSKRPKKLSHTIQYKASHAQFQPESHTSGDIPSGALRDR